MLIEKRNFLKGINSDVDPRLLDDGEVLNLMNGRVGVTKFGRYGRVENVPGSTQIAQQVFPPYGNSITLGSCPDVSRNRILFINYNTFEDHGIYCLDYSSPTSPVVYAVLYDSQVIGGLNLLKTKRVDRDMRVVGDLLFFTDDNNEPRRINIEAGIKMNHASYDTDVEPYSWPMNQSVITVVRNPPAYPLTFEKSDDNTFDENYISKEAFQFYWGYEYRDGEISVLSPLSTTANVNETDNIDVNSNLITITASLNETIPQDAVVVYIVAKYLISGKSFVIKRWDKDIASQLAEINAHNAGTTALTYLFYNNDAITTVPVDPAKPYDPVPIRTKTLEYTNRLFLGNNVDGYDTPKTSSLTATISSISAGAGEVADVYLGQAQFLINGTYFSYRAYYVNLTSLTPNGWYRLSGYTQTALSAFSYPPYPTLPAVPATIFVNEVVFVGTTSQDVSDSIAGSNITSFTLTDTLSNSTLSTANEFSKVQKSDSIKKVGIVFYDKALRRCGVYTNDDLVVNIPDRDYNYTTLYTGITWTLSNANAVNEIPDWAYYYQIVITKNLNVLKFQEAVTNAIKYVTKDANGQYVYNNTTVGGDIAIAINTDYLVGYGMGYTFQEGDILKIYNPTSVVVETVTVTGQDGQYILCTLVDIGSTANKIFIYEVRSPARYEEEPPFFEISQLYTISDPTEATREYLVLNGNIPGDVYLATRTHGGIDYTTERMSPNDKLWQYWFTDAGRPNFIDRIGQQWKKTSIKWSNTIIPGTRVNGLSSFEPLNQKILQTELNEINKLQLANKIPEQGQGNVMLAICTTQTASIYLGEVQLTAAALRGDIATTDSVIGTVNVLKGSFGTTQKSSIVEYLGLVFGIDLLNGVAWQYSNNGLDSVSRYKATRFFQNYCAGYLATNTNNLTNINGFSHIPTCIDPFHKEAIYTLPGFIYENYADDLPSYSSVPSYATSIVNRFDIYDELAKTMCFKFEENVWGQNFEWIAEHYDYLQNTMFAFKNGFPYSMYTNSANWNTFFGTQYPVRICGTANMNPSLLKDLANIAVEASEIPDFSVAMANVPNEQITDLAADDYTDQQGNLEAAWLGDRLDPNQSGTADQKLYTGSQLTDKALFWMLEWQVYDELFYCNFVNIGWQESRGQKDIANPVNR